jgi:hypothetical protein
MSDTPSSESLSLVRKLAQVMGAVDRIPKRGYNDHFKYKFVTESDVVDKIRQELAARQVVLVPSMTKSTRIDVGKTGSGAMKTLTVLEMTFTFMDGESNERIVCHWEGNGLDTEDKGTAKAMTSAEKYFCLRFFMIPTGDDPDAGKPAAADRRQPQQRPPDPTPKDDTRVISAEQVKTVKGLMRTHNTNVDEFKLWAEKRFKVTESKNILRKDFAAICAYIVEGVDITTGEAK